MRGTDLVVMAMVAAVEHPSLLVPVTEYTLLIAGDTVITEPNTPLLQVYVLAPEALKLMGAEGQTEETDLLATTTGTEKVLIPIL